MKLSLELDAAASEAFSDIECLTGMNPSRIFSYALSIMLWVIRQGIAGRIVASIDESRQSYRELEITALKQESTQEQAAEPGQEAA
ncbi:MAG: hypothetical protein WAM78_04540 [Candidatus Sulfotelmatobacter sp.]